MTLELTYERCVRSRSAAASCRACVDSCPQQAISFVGPRRSVQVTLDACVECGVCQATCPTEAFRGTFDVAALIAQRPQEVACGRDGLPCVGALAPEDLLTLALGWGRLRVIARDCAAGPATHERVRQAVERARVFARAIGAAAELEWKDESTPHRPGSQARLSRSRRRLLGLLVPRRGRGALRSPERLDPTALRSVGPTERRRRLFSAMPSALRLHATSLPAESVACASSRRIAASRCTGCMQCVWVCPTKALQAGPLDESILFEARHCVNCGLCQDVCELRAITPAPDLDVREFVDPGMRVLATFAMSACERCGRPMRAYREPTGVCPTCAKQRTAAREPRRSP